MSKIAIISDVNAGLDYIGYDPDSRFALDNQF